MSVGRKLALAYAARHPARMLLTSLAMIASACVVVWVVSGYDALVSQYGNKSTEYLGRFDLFLVSDAVDQAFLPAGVVDAIGRDPAVAECDAALQWTVRVQPDKAEEIAPGGPPGDDAGGRATQRPGGAARGPTSAGSEYGAGGPPRGVLQGVPKLVGTDADAAPYKLTEGRWIDRRDPTRRETVISNQSAEQMQVGLGDDLLVICGTKEYRLRIVGIVAQAPAAPAAQKQSSSGRPIAASAGSSLGPAAAAIYVPRALAEKISRQSGKSNLASIKLRDGASVADFQARWVPQVKRASPPVLLITAADIRNALEEGTMAAGARKQAWAATGMSLLAALFIIFTTLSMGVNERVRQFALMRAVGLTRWQVSRVITAEALLLALIGWCGGLAAGWGLLTVVHHAKPALFPNGVSLGGWCILLTGLSACGGAILASVLPAWRATVVQPLEAMSPRRAVQPSMKFVITSGLLGLALIAVNPLLVYVAPIADAARYGIYEAAGCTSMALGFLLLAPLAIALTELICGPLLARLLALDSRLLHFQLSANLWRTLGTTVSLTIGLGLYVAMMVWGYSMLEPFKPGTWVPDMLATFPSGGLPDTVMAEVRRLPGVLPEECIPLAVEQPQLADDITGSKQGNNVTRQDNVIMIGLDPQVAFGAAKPLIAAEFVAGTAAEAAAKMKQGRYCVVPDHFLKATGLKLGDRFGVVPPDKPDTSVQYTIAGAVSLPGWHWMTKFSGLRKRNGHAAAMIFAPYDELRRDFDLRQINFIWMNIDKRVGVEKIGATLQPIAERFMGERQPVNAQGTWSVGVNTFGPSLRVSTPEGVRSNIVNRADDVIWAMCELPLITLLVTSLGVVNTMMASIRARRWELGVLRAIGVTRWSMTRTVVAEGLLIGLISCLLSVGFGVLAGWCGIGISQYVGAFGGLATPLVIPWAKLALGISLALGLCLAASLWPAVSTGCTEPLKLLQEGRSAL
jgi:putative ABC transport system permease protein